MTTNDHCKKSKQIVFQRFDMKLKKSQFFRQDRKNKAEGQNISEIKPKPVLVVDLDETLIHSFTDKSVVFEADLQRVKVQAAEKSATYWVAKRPGLESFLQSMTKVFEVVIYTSSVREYAETIMEELGMKPYVSRVFHRDHCISSANGPMKLKDLELVGSDFERMILIDDSIIQTRRFPENSFLITPFRGDQKDKWLQLITPFLQNIVEHEDVRSVSQRFNTFMMEKELPRYSHVKFEKLSSNSSSDGDSNPTRSAISDDAYLSGFEDGITETARCQITSCRTSFISASKPSFMMEDLKTKIK